MGNGILSPSSSVAPFLLFIVLCTTFLIGCRDRVAVQEGPIIKKLGPPDEITYGVANGEAEPPFFISGVAPGRWAIYRYEVDGWIIDMMTKDKRVVRMTSFNMKESEEQARIRKEEIRKVLSP